MAPTDAFTALPLGLGATLFIDLWSLLLKRAFGIASLDYCLLGRWTLHMRRGVISHANIRESAPQPYECAAGWTAHYSIGIAFALIFLLVAPDGWRAQPTPAPAIAFGIATVVVPFFTLQPAIGLGIASSRSPSPGKARLKSLATHAVFGAGLYLWALPLS